MYSTTGILAMFGLPGGMEFVVIGFIGLLLFGKRLPDVARSVGKSIVEFKKGMRDVKNELDVASTPDSSRLAGGHTQPPSIPASPEPGPAETQPHETGE